MLGSNEEYFFKKCISFTCLPNLTYVRPLFTLLHRGSDRVVIYNSDFHSAVGFSRLRHNKRTRKATFHLKHFLIFVEIRTY